jgi:hypothetical protein
MGKKTKKPPAPVASMAEEEPICSVTLAGFLDFGALATPLAASPAAEDGTALKKPARKRSKAG